MKRPARAIALGVAVLVVAFSVVLATQVGSDTKADTTTSRLLGGRSPAFAVKTIDGQELTREGLAGRSVIVNFWNTWCIPCQEELPALKEFFAQHASDSDFAMVGIVRDDTANAVRAYVQAEGLHWTIALDPDAVAALAFGTRGQPETFAIAPNGVIVGFQYGPSRVKDLDQLLAEARGTGNA